jgi:hypothetical protein
VLLAVLWVRWRKSSDLDDGKCLRGAVVDDDVADVRSIRRQTGLETAEDADIEVSLVLSIEMERLG